VSDNANARDTAYATALVRADDRPRYYATLFAPYDIRDDLFALYAFAAEVARVPSQVRETPLGEIRLKWWSDAVARLDEVGGETPTLRALARAVSRRGLPLAPLIALIEARSADFYADATLSIGDLERRFGETESVVFQLAVLTAASAAGGETADASGHAGIAYGLARRLANFAQERARGRSFLPVELLREAGLSPSEIFATPPPVGLADVLAKLVGIAERHRAVAEEAAATIAWPARSVFLPLAVVSPLLRQVERLGPALAERPAGLSDLNSLWRIGRRYLGARRTLAR
jgi:phytoene synthase